MPGILDALINNTLTGGYANQIDPISKFRSDLGRYPGNNKIWWAAKAQADDDEKRIKEGDFLPKVLDKLFSGNNRVARGHYILNEFRKDRAAVSGVSGIPLDEKPYRPNGTCFFAGRVWWSSPGRVYYSQLLDHKSKAGLCYQEADPTSEDISDLIATDGGELPIPEALNIVKLVPISNGVMAFANNGVWFVGSGSGGFSATDVSLNKVSSTGTANPLSIVQVADSIYWWSEVGIHALEQASGQFGPIPGKFGNDNLAESTIQSFYNAIPDHNKKNCRVVYDPKNNVIQWLYSMSDNPFEYTYVLNYDVTLQAFYPWQVSEVDGNSPHIRGVFLSTGLLTQEAIEDVTMSDNTPVTTNSLDSVTISVYNTVVEDKPTNLVYLTGVGTEITLSQFNNRDFVDWEAHDAVGLPYTSFMETGYELNEDAMRKKQTPRVFIHFRRTEDDPSAPPSSCKFRTKWDWTSSADSNKWSRQIEAYRPKTMRLPTSADFASGMPVVISNNKVRGSGKAIQFRFECDEPGKNFDLLGWAVNFVGNTKP